MKKGSVFALILGTVGGLAGGIGMCMCLLPQWNLFAPGAVLGSIGALILLSIWPVYRRVEKKPRRALSRQMKLTFSLGVLGSLILGTGLVLYFVPSIALMTPGIVIGSVGVLFLLLTVLQYRRAKGKEKLRVHPKKALCICIGILGTLSLGIGMSLIMVAGSAYLISGMIVGVLGILLCIANFPIYFAGAQRTYETATRE